MRIIVSILIEAFWSDIPALELELSETSLGRARSISPISTTGADTSGPSSRRTSISSIGRPGTAMSVRSGSGASSRSTSFSLPNDARSAIRADRRSPGEEVEFDEEMDEECEFFILLMASISKLYGQLLPSMQNLYVLVVDIIQTKQKL